MAAVLAVGAGDVRGRAHREAGPKVKHNAEHTAVRHGVGCGSLTVTPRGGGRRVPVTCAGARTLDGTELPRGSYPHSAGDDLQSRAAMARILAGWRPLGVPVAATVSIRPSGAWWSLRRTV